IKFEGGKYIPFDINESILDCAILDKSHLGNINRVLLVAAKKDKVNSYREIFKEMDMEVVSIDVDTVAILNAFQRLNLEAKQESVYAMINIGAKFSNMNIITKGYPYFTRDIMWGGMDISSRIKELLGLSPNEAEILKCNPGEKKADIAGIIMPALEKFTSEIRMSFDYFETQFGKNIEKLYISGGTAYLFNMQDFLKNSLELEVILWNPFEGIKIIDDSVDNEFRNSSSKFTVATGLALRK
ncbi:MAG: pilus assembly protein PilM, partial [Candidatus Omnitrophica bacterium]|nr:pilus assembly protein PilM [Candidatus Omnitrophota bacterium]